MIHPSYVDLMQAVNSQVEEGDEPVISSRYSIVMATARRARQLIAGDDPLVRAKGSTKPLSIAVEELNQQEVKILTEEDKARQASWIALLRLVKGVMEKGIDILGFAAPDHM